MTRALLLLATLLLALAATGAQGQSTSFRLVSQLTGQDYVWYLEGQTVRNPTLTVPAGETITIVASKGDTEEGIPHNIKVGNNDASDFFDQIGASVTYTFKAPSSGTLQYLCEVHATTQKGTIKVAGGDKESPGAAMGALVALVGAAMLVGRRRA